MWSQPTSAQAERHDVQEALVTVATPPCFRAQQTWHPKLRESTWSGGKLGRKQLEVVYASKPTSYKRGSQGTCRPDAVLRVAKVMVIWGQHSHLPGKKVAPRLGGGVSPASSRIRRPLSHAVPLPPPSATGGADQPRSQPRPH